MLTGGQEFWVWKKLRRMSKNNLLRGVGRAHLIFNEYGMPP